MFLESKNKNYLFSLINVFVSAIQSLWLLSYVQKIMGVEAYGYIAIITSFVNMANIITIALTTYTSRYVSVELHKKNKPRADMFFNTSFFGLLFISALLILIFLFLAINVRLWLNVSSQFVSQIQLLLFFVAGSFIFTTISTPMKSGVYFVNKIYIMHGLQILSYLSRIIFALILYNCFPAKLWYAYLGSFIIDFVSLGIYFMIYKRLMPGICISPDKVSINAIKEILASGIWLSINKAGAVLLTNINTYILSILVSVFMTGIYSTLVQFVTLLSVLTMTIISTFVPNIYRLYAEGDISGMEKYISKCVKTIAVINGFLVGGMLIYQKYLLGLFISDIYMHYEFIIILTLIYIPFTIPANVLEQVLIAYNRFSIPAVSQLLFGVANVILILIINNLYNIGIYAVLTATLCTSLSRDLWFIPLYSSKILNYKAKHYYHNLGYGITSLLFTVVISFCIVSIKMPLSWSALFIEVFVVSIIFMTPLVFWKRRCKEF